MYTHKPLLATDLQKALRNEYSYIYIASGAT